MEINDAKHLELFSVNPQPGEVIVDQTLSAVRDDGLAAAVTPHTTGGGEIPTISYTVPADNAKLDEVIRDAQRVAAMRPEPPPMLSSILGGSRRFLWFFVVSLVILGALGAKWLRG